VTLLSVMKLLPCATLVDANHGNSNRPGSLTDTESEVSVVGVNVAALLESLDDLDDGL
jgi:hypothetical protein